MKRLLYLSFLSLTTLAVLSCKQDITPGMDEVKDKAKVNFINAAPDAKAPIGSRILAMWFSYNNVDYYTQPIQFPWSSQYLAVDPGAIAVKLDTARATNATIPGGRGSATSFTINVERDSYYSLYAVGTAQKPEYVFYKEDLSLPTPGKVKIRFLNLSTDAGKIDIVNAANGTVLAGGLDYKTITPFVEMDPADFGNVRVRDSATQAFITPANRRILLEKNNVFTVWATGLRNPASGVTHTLRLAYHANRYNF